MARPVRRVLMTADCVGGVWSYALQLAAELGRREVEVTLVVLGGKPSHDQASQAAALKTLTLIGADFRLEWMPGCDADVALSGELLLELEAELRPDIVHLSGYAYAVLPFAAPVLVVAHSDVATWWRACRGAELPAEWTAYAKRVAAGLAAADLVVAPTRAYLEALAGAHGAPRRACVIANGRDPAAFAPNGRKRDVTLAAGRLWDEAKNIATLCQAAHGLSWPVLVAGETASPDGSDAALPGNVLALGHLSAPDMARRMAEAAVFAAPARYEPFGLAILEAALSGCALVLGDIATLRELWDGAALFVPPDDPAVLRDTIEALHFDPERTAVLGRAARRRALGFGSRRMADAYMRAYAGLLAAAPARRAAEAPRLSA